MKTLAWHKFGPNGPYTVNYLYIALQFKLEDMWIGVFWRTDHEIDKVQWSAWVCILPMLPIFIRRVRYL